MCRLQQPARSGCCSYGAVRHPALALAHSCRCPGFWLTSEEGSNLNNNLLVLHGGAVLNHDLGNLASLGGLLSSNMEHWCQRIVSDRLITNDSANPVRAAYDAGCANRAT